MCRAFSRPLPAEHGFGLVLLAGGGELRDEFRIVELGALALGAGALPLDRLLKVGRAIAGLGREPLHEQHVVGMLLDPVERLDDGRLLLRRIAKCVAVEIGTGQFREVLHRLARRRKAADADVHHVLERDVARPRHVEPEHGIVAQAHVVKADREHHHGHRRDRAGIGFDGVACSCDLAAFRRGERVIEPPADLHLRPFLGGAGCGVRRRHEDGDAAHRLRRRRNRALHREHEGRGGNTDPQQHFVTPRRNACGR